MRVKPFLKSAARQHKDPEVRVAHARELDPNEEQAAATLASLATDDEDADVRVAAIERLLDLAVLRSLLDANGDDADSVRAAAEKRLGALVETGEMSDVAVRALLDTHASRLAPIVAGDSPVPAQRERALDALDDESALVGVIQRSRLHDARLAAASRLTHHDTMRAALTACRSRDKVVAKLLQQRLDAEAAAEQARIATRHAVTTTLEAMRNLADSVWSPQHGGRAQALKDRWAAFEPTETAAENEAFAEAGARVQALLDAHPKASDDGARTGGGSPASADAEAEGAPSFDDGSVRGSNATDGTGDAPAGVSEGASGGSGASSSAGATAGPVPEADAASVALAESLSDVGIEALLAAVDGDAGGNAAEGSERKDAGNGVAAGGESVDESAADGSGGNAGHGDAADETANDETADDKTADDETAAGESVAEGDAADEAETDGASSAAAKTDAPAATSPLSEALRAHARSVAVLFDPPFEHQRARPAALKQRLRRVDALLDTKALLPGLDLSRHRYVQELGEHRAVLTGRLVQSEQESTDRIKATHRQFAAFGGLVGEGKWAPANSLMTRLRKKLAAMEPAERSGLDDKLARAEQQLAEMGDWQDFAARPKLEALCVEMEALPGKELVPEKLAKEVRDLQSQWKGLGPSRAANELWPRFKTAGDTAYEPCKAWFAAKNDERKEKTAARRKICEALEADVVMLGNAYVADEPEPEHGSGSGADGDAGTGTDADAKAAADVGAAPADEASAGGTAATDGETGGAAANENAGTTDGSEAAADAGVGTGADGSDVVADTSGAASGVEATSGNASSGEAAVDAAADAVPSAPDAAAKNASSSGGAANDASKANGEAPADGAPKAKRSRGARRRPVPEIPDVDPDWKAVQRRVSDAKREWSANRVHGRKPDRSLEGRFSAALRPFERALATRYKANEAEKRALIEKAEALAGGEITQHVANQAKSLLSAWKLVGIVPRRVDQALWETFNGHLGTIFKHQQAVQREKRRAGFEHVDRARAIAKELRVLARGDSVDEAAVQALADEFHALPDFPDRDRRGLERDFRASLDATARVQETAGKRRKQAEREERRRLVELCERLESAVEDPSAASDTLREDVVHAWEASETRVAREMAQRLEARRDAALAHLESGTGYDLAANEEARRDLLIRMEVAADVETPPEDKSRRMKYQLENLQSGMTSAGVADRRATLAALEEEWLAAPPAARAVHDALHSRYLKALGR